MFKIFYQKYFDDVNYKENEKIKNKNEIKKKV